MPGSTGSPAPRSRNAGARSASASRSARPRPRSPRTSPPASGSAPAWRSPRSTARACCSSTSPPRASTCAAAGSSGSSSRTRRTRVSRSSSPPTSSRRSSTATGRPSSTPGGSSPTRSPRSSASATPTATASRSRCRPQRETPRRGRSARSPARWRRPRAASRSAFRRSSRRLVAELAATGTFDPRPVSTRAELQRALVSGRASVAIVIPPDFDRALLRGTEGGRPPEIQVLYDGGEAVLAGNAEGFLRAQLAHTGATLATTDLSRRPVPGQAGVDVVTRALFNPTLDGTRFMVSGTFGFVLSFLTTLITAVSIVNERLAGTFEQLQVTPATSLEIFLGKILPLGAVFALDVLLMALVAGFALGVWPQGNILFFLVVSTFYVLVSLALGLLFSATSSTAAEAVQKTVVFSIPLVQLSGFAFPIRNMPAFFRWLTELFPATHYIRLSRAIYLRAEGPTALLPEIGFLVLFGAVLIVLALRSLETRA